MSIPYGMTSQAGKKKRTTSRWESALSAQMPSLSSDKERVKSGNWGKVIASKEDQMRKVRNAARFADHLAGGSKCQKSKKRSRNAMNDGGGASGALITGTSTSLEKSYFRLTSAPNPADVRPPSILRKSLQHVKQMWLEEELYEFACDQLKAIRQDLTVQGIEDDLTVDVYQTHARIALESGDMDEYNQCQSRLKELHHAGVAGVRMDEFTGYRLVYSLYRENYREVNSTMMALTAAQRRGEGVAHALAVVKAYNLGDYCSFFRLYVDAPNMTGYMMDFLVMRMRKYAFRVMVKAFSPTIPLAYIKDQLKFDDDIPLYQFVERYVRAVLVRINPGEDPAVDVKATRAAWVQQGMWS